MQVFSQALSVLAAVLLLVEHSVHALALPIDTRSEGTSDLKGPHSDHYNHKEGHHKPGPVEDAFVLYGLRSTQPTSNTDKPYAGHIVDEAFVGYTREEHHKPGPVEDAFMLYGPRSTQPTPNTDKPYAGHIVDEAFVSYTREDNKNSGLNDIPDTKHVMNLVEKAFFSYSQDR